MTLTELERALRGAALGDVLVGGFIERDERTARFYPQFSAVYFEVSGRLVEFRTVETTGRMRIAFVDSVQVEGLDDELPAETSLSELMLDNSTGATPLVTLTLWGAEDGVECHAAEFELANGQRLFVDPTYHFGIRLGGAVQKRVWFENWPSSNTQEVRVLSCQLQS